MFVSRHIRANADRSPWGDFWFQPVGIRTASSVRVTGDAALQYAAVWACVRVLAESFAVLPFKLYRPRAQGGKTPVTDHWLYRLIAQRPNRFQTPFEWREMMQGHLALRGNAFNEIVNDGRGGIAELMPLHPDRVRMELLDNGSFRYRYTDRMGNQTVLRRDQVWHLRGLGSDGYVGLNPVELHAQTIGLALAQQDYASRYFANDAKPTGGWIEMPGSFADKAAKENFRESWQKAQGGSNRGKVAVLEKGMKFHEIGINNRDSQFIESRGMSTTEIARIFRVPPHLIGDLSKATFSNIEQQSLDFVIHTMTPWAERWEASIEHTLLGEDSGLECEFDFKRLLRGDAASRSTYYHNGILDGWLTRNEARNEEGLDPLDGLDEPLRPLNMVEESEASDELAETGPDDDQAKPQPEDESAEARLRSVLIGNADRMAKRIVAGDWPNDDVLASALAISLADAVAVRARGLQENWAAGQRHVVATELLGIALKGKA